MQGESMPQLVYIAVSVKQYLEALRRKPPCIVPIENSSIGEKAAQELLSGSFLVLRGEIPAAYFASAEHEIVLGYQKASFEDVQEFDIAALEQAVLISIEEQAMLMASQLKVLHEKMRRRVMRRDRAIAVPTLDPLDAYFTGVRSLEKLDDIQNAIERLAEPSQSSFRQIEYAYFHPERAKKHHDAPLPYPAFLRRIIETDPVT